MNIFSNKIKNILVEYGIKPKKKFGQNFIFDKNILNKIVNEIEPIKNSLIIEIGPGPGNLSNIILERNPKSILLIEKDISFKKILKDITKQYSQINTKILFEDFLKLDLKTFNTLDKTSIKFISNLPYYISTQILLKILPFEKNVSKAVFMFQKEVADRLLAKPGKKEYSKLSVICQYSCDIKKVFNIKSSIFFPKPDVDSCLLTFKPKHKINKKELSNIKKITKLAFEKRRKTLKNSLSKIQGISEYLISLDINPNLRAENLSISQYTKLAALLEKKTNLELL